MNFVLTRNRTVIIGVVIILALGLLFLVFFGARLIERPPKIELTVWGIFDDKNAFKDALEAYGDIQGNVSIKYVQKVYQLDEVQNYEKDLISALAAGNGPDVFMVHNTWLPKHQKIMAPLDLNLQTALAFPFSQFRDAFPKVVEQDFTRETTIYASPLFLDSLAMFYNRDLFDSKGIALVPSTWQEFERIIPKLREINPGTGDIKKAAAAIGGSEQSINRATDLLSIIMMQQGTEFTNSGHARAIFAGGTEKQNPGLLGLKFYSQFADTNSPLFTWNERFPYSVDSFASGDTAIMFNYAHQIPIIKSKNAFLDFSVAPLPQLSQATQPVNYANYWGFAISNQSKYPDWAWNFILAITTNEDIINSYLDKTEKPPALRTLISKKQNDPDLGVFARQALTARSWWQKDNFAIENIFSNMLRSVIRREFSAEVALRRAEDEVSLLMRQDR